PLRIPERLIRAPSPVLIEGAAFGCALASPRSATAATDLEAARTSVSVTRPSGPVPFTFARSTPSSAAIRRATGDAFTRPSSAVFSSRAAAGEGLGRGGVVSLSFAFRDNVAGRHLVAFLLFPHDESSLRHRVTQFGHLDFRHGENR